MWITLRSVTSVCIWRIGRRLLGSHLFIVTARYWATSGRVWRCCRWSDGWLWLTWWLLWFRLRRSVLIRWGNRSITVIRTFGIWLRMLTGHRRRRRLLCCRLLLMRLRSQIVSIWWRVLRRHGSVMRSWMTVGLHSLHSIFVMKNVWLTCLLWDTVHKPTLRNVETCNISGNGRWEVDGH